MVLSVFTIIPISASAEDTDQLMLAVNKRWIEGEDFSSPTSGDVLYRFPGAGEFMIFCRVNPAKDPLTAVLSGTAIVRYNGLSIIYTEDKLVNTEYNTSTTRLEFDDREVDEHTNAGLMFTGKYYVKKANNSDNLYIFMLYYDPAVWDWDKASASAQVTFPTLYYYSYAAYNQLPGVNQTEDADVEVISDTHTCEDAGYIVYKATYTAPDESYIENERTFTGGAPAAHLELSLVAAAEPTRFADGNFEYWYCAACGKYFSDEDAGFKTVMQTMYCYSMLAAGEPIVTDD